MTFTIAIRNVYGKQTIYPVCERARIFAAIAGTKTLSLQTVAQIKLLGYEIVIQPQELQA